MGRHRGPLRPDHRLQCRPLADRERRPAARPSRGAGSGPAGPTALFLTVALVNPHDVMWFPVDQPGYRGAPPRRRGVHPLGARVGGMEGRRPPPRLHRPLPRGDRPAAAQLRRRPAHQARGPPPVAVGPAARTVGIHRSGRQGCLAPPPRLLCPSAPAGRPEPRCGAVRARGLGHVGRHHRHLHLRPRRHVRLPRAPIEGTLRLRRDHEGAPVPEGARCDHPGLDHLVTGLPRGPGRHHLRPGRGGPGGERGHRPGHRPGPGTGRPDGRRSATTSCSPRTRPRPPSSTRSATPYGASTTAVPSTPTTTASEVASRPPGCGASPPAASCSTSTAPSTTTTTSGTTTRPIPTSWSTWPTTGPAEPSWPKLYDRMRSYERESFVTFA